MQSETQLISEPITPDPATFDTRVMATGQAGLPTGFTWRDRHYTIRHVVRDWKESQAFNHTATGDRYYRRHFWQIVVDSGETMTLYALRRVKLGEPPKRRWWLYTVDSISPDSPARE